MFARTERLLLRPGFPEDAPALARAIGDEMIVRNLGRAPWPYRVEDAQQGLAAPHEPGLPRLLMMERTDDAPRLVGSISLSRKPSGAIEMGYWIARRQWNRGFATEAGRAVLDMARALRLPSVDASVFEGNPASERVLEKLGFAATGISAPRFSCARGVDVMSRLYRLRLADAEEAMAA